MTQIPAGSLSCDFPGCKQQFKYENVIDWISHGSNHFLPHPPPSTVNCTFCETQFSGDDPDNTWNQRMKHIKDHLIRDPRNNHPKKDFGVLDYLLEKQLISTDLYN
ncbi:hypothetical protein BJ875DRAFT_474774 [Amylocarpus encephaloides]|uniref:Uncharacterized protein n=1 Tax=Amylocarpus encephaloides TaxID=45428 RepID=A0A9P7Y9R4_9HELO|nr:hypothetical protein BJ875DRAFT_474774 [Amylocarpus encephaloides]